MTTHHTNTAQYSAARNHFIVIDLRQGILLARLFQGSHNPNFFLDTASFVLDYQSAKAVSTAFRISTRQRFMGGCEVVQ